jgi:hypothetical protein
MGRDSTARLPGAGSAKWVSAGDAATVCGTKKNGYGIRMYAIMTGTNRGPVASTAG